MDFALHDQDLDGMASSFTDVRNLIPASYLAFPFGNPAIRIIPDPWFCVPVSRQVCRSRERVLFYKPDVFYRTSQKKLESNIFQEDHSLSLHSHYLRSSNLFRSI